MNAKSILPIVGFLSVAHCSIASDRPNILFAFADDMGRYAHIYDEIDGVKSVASVATTPVMDRLGREGVIFRNAYVAAPSSTPCRSALLSGQYFWRTERGAILNDAVWDDSIPSFPLLLRESGYHIGKTYKVWSPGTPADAPYGGQKYAYEKNGDRFCRFSQEILRSGNPDIEAERQKIYDEVLNNFEDFLDERPEGSPFCYWWGPWNTHREWQKGSGKTLWGINPDDLKGLLPAGFPDIPEVREDFADYLGEVQAFDTGLGILLKKLEEIGELDNTIIVVSGDHGVPGFPMAKCNLYELGIKVPLIVRYPKMIESGRVVDDMVSLPDLAPTFLEIGETAIPEEMTAKSILPLLTAEGSGVIDASRNFIVAGRERHVSGARIGTLPYPQRTIVMNGFKYIRNFAPDRWPMGDPEGNFKDMDDGPTKQWLIKNLYNQEYEDYINYAFAKRPYEELYDLKNDPDELNNLALHPDYSATKKDLSDKLEEVLIESKDPRMLQSVENCVFEWAPYTNQIKPTSVDALYIVGEATPAKYDLKMSTALQMKKVGSNLYSWVGNLKMGDFKFLINPNSYVPSYNRDAQTGQLYYRESFEDKKDDKFHIDKAGAYSIDLDVENMTINVEEVKTLPQYKKLWLYNQTSGQFIVMERDSHSDYIFSSVVNEDGEYVVLVDESESSSGFVPAVGNSMNLVDKPLESIGWKLEGGKSKEVYVDIYHQTFYQLELKTFPCIYPIGSATPYGWNINQLKPIVGDVNNSYLYKGFLHLIPGELKFLIEQKQGAAAVRPYTIGEKLKDGKSSKVQITQKGTDYKFLVEKEGDYEISVDLKNMLVTINSGTSYVEQINDNIMPAYEVYYDCSGIQRTKESLSTGVYLRKSIFADGVNVEKIIVTK